MKPVTVLCATTRQWNPGDEWIAAGIRRLVEKALGPRRANWVLYDRSPDCFERPWIGPERRQGWMGNSYWGQRPFEPDLVVAAGTPEWHGPHFRWLFEHFPEKPWFLLGVGSGEEGLRVDAIEAEVIRNALIVTRDLEASAELADLGFSCRALPCPSLFAAPFESPVRKLRRVAVVLQSDKVPNQAVETGLKHVMRSLATELASRYDTTIVCNYVDEFLEHLAFDSVPVRYHYDSAEYVNLLADSDVVVSTRLHSALLANSLLKPAIVVNLSRRVRSAAALCPCIWMCDPEKVLDRIGSLSVDSVVRGLLNWKRTVEAEYLELVRNGLGRHGLC